MTNENFRALLLKYFRNGCLTRADRLTGVFHFSIPYYLNSKKIASAFQETAPSPEPSKKITITVENYNGNNTYVHDMSHFLKTYAADGLAGVYVHGSTGTSEEIAYSDFDGVVVIKNEVLLDHRKIRKLALVLLESEKIMLRADPLQHHGWFILSERDFLDFPENYFPHELFRYAKNLFGEKELLLYIRENGRDKDFSFSFNRLAGSIHKKLESGSFLRNYYLFKNFLSECMLLPSLFIQARDKKGVFKKYSFEMLKEEFPEGYSVMEEISQVRKSWSYQPSGGRVLFLRYRLIFLDIFPPGFLSGKLPTHLRHKFDPVMCKRLAGFINLLSQKING